MNARQLDFVRQVALRDLILAEQDAAERGRVIQTSIHVEGAVQVALALVLDALVADLERGVHSVALDRRN